MDVWRFMRKIEKITDKNRKQVNDFIIQHWYTTKMVICGKIIDLSEAEGFVFIDETKIIGLITYIIYGEVLEILSLNSIYENQGIGTVLLNKVIGEAENHSCRRIVLITTNDNINALRFYQKRGFEMIQLFYNSVEKSRKLKPEIPLIGDNNIPLKSEIQMELQMKKN